MPDSSDKTLRILLQVQADVAALNGVLIPGLKDLNEKLDNTRQSALGVKEAFGFEAARKAIDEVSRALAQIPARIIEGIKSGVEFTAEIQNLQTSMAGVLRLTQSNEFADFGKAKAAAGVYIEELKQGANEAGLTYRNMFAILEESQAQLSAAGITNIHDQIEAARLLVQAMRAVGVSAQNASRDIGDILQGNAAQTQGGTRLAAALHLTKEEFDNLLQSAIRSGTLLEFLQTRFAALGDAITDSSQNAGASFARLQNFITDLQLEAAKPIMEPLKAGIDGAITAEALGQYKILARFIGEIAAAAVAAAGEIAKLGSAIAEVGQKYQGLAAVLRTISQITPTGLAFHDFFAEKFDQATKAVQADTAALQQGTAALNTHGASQQRVTQLTDKQREALEKVRQETLLLNATAAGNTEEIAAAKAALAYREKLDALRAAKVPQEEAAKAATEEYVATYNSVIAAQRKKDAAAANRDAAQGERDAHRELRDLLAQEQLQLEAIKSNISSVESNPFLTIDQKNVALAQLLPQAIAQLNAQIQQNKASIAGSALDPQQLNAVRSAIQRDSAEITKLQQKIQLTTFGGQFRASLIQWVNQFGTTAQQLGNLITNTIGAAVNGVGNAITGAIFRTQSWGQAFAQIAQQIVGNIIQIALQWAVSRALMAVLNIAYGQTEAAASSAQATASAAAWSPAAVAASTASYGAAAAAGLAAFIAAETSGTAFATGLSSAGGGFEQGGYTGPGHSRQVAGIVHRDEFVFSAPAVRRLGVDNLQALHSGFNRATYESGGLVGGNSRGAGATSGLSPRQSRPVINQALFLDMKEAQKWLRNREGEKFIVDVVNSRGGTLRT